MDIADHVHGHAVLDVQGDQALLLLEMGMCPEHNLPDIP